MKSERLTRLIELIERERPNYANNLLATLDVNKIRAKYERPGRPVVILTDCDSMGLVTLIKPNHLSGIVVPVNERPKPVYSENQLIQIKTALRNKTIQDRVSVMMEINSALNSYLKSAPMTFFNAGPVLLFTIDDLGFPTSYKSSDNGHPYFKRLSTLVKIDATGGDPSTN